MINPSVKDVANDLHCPWIKHNFGLEKDPLAFDQLPQKSMPASRVPAVSLSYFNLQVEGIQDKLDGHILPGELVAIVGSKTLRDHMLKTLAGHRETPENGQVLLQGLEKCKAERRKFISYIDNKHCLLDNQTVNRSLVFASKM